MLAGIVASGAPVNNVIDIVRIVCSWTTEMTTSFEQECHAQMCVYQQT